VNSNFLAYLEATGTNDISMSQSFHFENADIAKPQLADAMKQDALYEHLNFLSEVNR